MASSTEILLGPPSVACAVPSLSEAVKSPESPVSDDHKLISQTATLNLGEKPPMGLTENFSPTFLSSGNPCLDFFFHIVPDTPPADLIQRLAISWSHDPLTTLKLVCNLRGVRGTGKSDKEGFYSAAFWLYQNHPKTLALNLPALVDFGYLKDLPEILYRILEGQQMERGKKRVWRKKIQKIKRKNKKSSEISGDMKDRILENAEEISGAADKVKARALRKQRELEKAKKALERYNSDAKYRLLFDRTADLFADLLKSDLKFLNSNELNKIGLASKWCPSVDSSYDKTTLICEAIARRMFSRDEYEGIEEAHYAYRIRDRLRRQVLVPLHKALELPEVYMSAKEWNLLKYNRVSSVAMKNYKKLFGEHDSERFSKFLEDVKSGKAKIAAGALLPHQIINQLEDDSGSEVGAEVAELQWARMVDDLAKKGKLKDSLAVCDVSGSMSGTPMEVCVALGLLVSELNEEPWRGKVITFSENPQLHIVKGSSLKEKTEFIRQMDWGMNTNFQKVFDQILEVAVENNLSDDQMIKRLFVFSDMEFDSAMGNDHMANSYSKSWEERLEVSKQQSKEKWETDYEVIQSKYKEKGFKNVPEMVFWNLRDSSATPVVAKQKGVAMVSGFSKNLLTLFLEEGGIVNPEDVMWLAIKGEEYKKLAVYD